PLRWEARGMTTPSPLTLLAWRRTVAEMYADVRAAASPTGGHDRWRAGRDKLFLSHPDSPLSADAKSSFAGLPVAPYDPAWRFECALEPAEPAHLDVPTGTDGIVPFDRVGRVRIGELGTLDVWRLGSYGGGLFVPVKDASAGQTTYGGGRYLLDTVKGADLGG